MWLGGLAFFAGVIVEVGSDVLGSHLEFGLITRQVAVGLNLTASVVIAALAADLMIGTQRQRRQWLLWSILASSQIALWILLPWVDALLDAKAHKLLDADAFYFRHRIYLLVSTLEWITGAVYFRRLLAAG